jgi:uncharacterized damage-inducible protein DinB
MKAPATSAARSLADCLSELSSVVGVTDDVTYHATREDRVSGSIAAHVRHTIDHLVALFDGIKLGCIDYDSRRRGTDIERSRMAARAELDRLTHLLYWLSEDDLRVALEVDGVVAESGRRVTSYSTVARELMFVLSHTIHHKAIIALLLATRGQRTPERFAMAPSTPGLAPCAQSA